MCGGLPLRGWLGLCLVGGGLRTMLAALFPIGTSLKQRRREAARACRAVRGGLHRMQEPGQVRLAVRNYEPNSPEGQQRRRRCQPRANVVADFCEGSAPVRTRCQVDPRRARRRAAALLALGTLFALGTPFVSGGGCRGRVFAAASHEQLTQHESDDHSLTRSKRPLRRSSQDQTPDKRI